MDYRFQKFGKSGPAVVYKEFNKRFCLSSINDLWLKDECIYHDIYEYLISTYNNTIDGRIKKAASLSGYRHTMGHLMRKSVEVINTLGWNDNQFHTWLYLNFCVKSRNDLPDEQLDDMIMALDRFVQKIYKM